MQMKGMMYMNVTWFILGGIIGIILMSLVRASKKDIITEVKRFEGAIEHERLVAIKEKRSADYIDGMTRIINLFRKLFSEELEEK